jgi:hypothetical protein
VVVALAGLATFLFLQGCDSVYRSQLAAKLIRGHYEARYHTLDYSPGLFRVERVEYFSMWHPDQQRIVLPANIVEYSLNNFADITPTFRDYERIVAAVTSGMESDGAVVIYYVPGQTDVLYEFYLVYHGESKQIEATRYRGSPLDYTVSSLSLGDM